MKQTLRVCFICYRMPARKLCLCICVCLYEALRARVRRLSPIASRGPHGRPRRAAFTIRSETGLAGLGGEIWEEGPGTLASWQAAFLLEVCQRRYSPGLSRVVGPVSSCAVVHAGWLWRWSCDGTQLPRSFPLRRVSSSNRGSHPPRWLGRRPRSASDPIESSWQARSYPAGALFLDASAMFALARARAPS